MDTYHPFPIQPPPLSARNKLAVKVLESLSKHNVSVVGRRHYGKSVLLSHVAGEARKSGKFDQVVEWNLRQFTPHDDGDFFREMCHRISDQLGGKFAADARDFLSNKDEQTASTIRALLEIFEGEGQVLLLVMDGMDDPLSSSGLSKGVWDHLCSFTDKGSLRILAGSRKKLRELCMNTESRTSDFFRRFEDPVTVLGAFDADELSDYLADLEKDHPMDKGARSEFDRQTGGVPILCAGMARKLSEHVPGPLNQNDVLSAAEQIEEEESETLPAAMDSLEENERIAFAEVIARGTLEGNHGSMEKTLKALGLVKSKGGKLESSCGMLDKFLGSQKEGLCSVRELFGSPEAYARNIQAVSSLRNSHSQSTDPDLQEFISGALADQKNPKVFLGRIRNIIEHALCMVWKVEAPNQEVPKFTSPFGLEFMQKCEGGRRLPNEVPKQLRCLDLLTDPRNGASPKRVNRKIYCLLNSLKGYGDLGQHQQGSFVSPGFAAVVCLTVVELSNELSYIEI
jgi:hypothetical protein